MQGTPDNQSGWDMHDHGADLARDQLVRRPAGSDVTGQVVCHHAFGLGVRINVGEYGHVNITEVGTEAIRRTEDFPPIGAEVTGVVLGYSGVNRQLRLSLQAAL